MAIENHALSNGKLGNFVTHSTYNVSKPGIPADWRTLFSYELGDVELSSTNNGQTYVYKTTVFSEVDKNPIKLKNGSGMFN